MANDVFVKKMEYGDFKKLSDNMKTAYLQDLIDFYNVNTGAIAEMFGVHRTTIQKIITKLKVKTLFQKNKTMSLEDYSIFCEQMGLAGKTRQKNRKLLLDEKTDIKIYKTLDKLILEIDINQ